MSKPTNRPRYQVFTSRVTKDGKTVFIKIGAAFTIKNDGLSVQLDALPINGEMVLFPPREKNQS